MEKSIAVLGGDGRSVQLAKLLADDGFAISTWGIDAVNAAELSEAAGAEVIVLPIPLSREGKITGTEMKVEELFSCLSPSQRIFAGAVRAEDYVAASRHSLHITDYMDREEFAVRNVVPTVEGALELAMHALPVTLHGAECLVLGYGRIGKLLAHHLHALGAEVSVAARRQSDFAWIESYGYGPLHSAQLAGRLGKFRVIFNTVPHQLLDAPLLSQLRRDCVLIELASVSGFDAAAAKSLGLQLVSGSGLPGRCAPETAAAAMKKIILEECYE
ncbi:MAG: dipicolinate synthase [Oscillospiraceae bacterium]|nr:dipicolinate synthase [Oscillospiraceae bacterium]